jgi:rhodanese-related sulfurtransferase
MKRKIGAFGIFIWFPISFTLLYVIAQRLWQEIQDGSDILIVDTRNEDAYAEEHIEGAISVPSERIEAGDWQPPEGKQLVLY